MLQHLDRITAVFEAFTTNRKGNTMYVTIVPAYGRDYKTAKAARHDWDTGKDFIISNLFHEFDGKAMNKQQASPAESYSIRFDRQTKTTSVKG